MAQWVERRTRDPKDRIPSGAQSFFFEFFLVKHVVLTRCRCAQPPCVGKATRISHGKIPIGTSQCTCILCIVNVTHCKALCALVRKGALEMLVIIIIIFFLIYFLFIFLLQNTNKYKTNVNIQKTYPDTQHEENHL